jgi:hypothetical protein
VVPGGLAARSAALEVFALLGQGCLVGSRVSINHLSGRSHEALNPLSIVAGFLPWIAFTFIAQRLAADGVAWSTLIADAMTVIALVWGGHRHSPTELNLFSLVLFAAMA